MEKGIMTWQDLHPMAGGVIKAMQAAWILSSRCYDFNTSRDIAKM